MNESESCARMNKEERFEIFRTLCGRGDMGLSSKIVIGPDPSGVFYGTLRYVAIEDRFHLGAVIHLRRNLSENRGDSL